ncbi:hypothetical protein JAAARDRAFT_180011 [Jaapia argillacea MUCL 33604]|uniref:Uncharacterized protein n=1 Tax=Jaapia argillacea MUCL 33604 TaxID=933084 RepID=A0A067PYZ7_9AGAM|nr:hypothetical protein JAAARDRAFT_180011 [Jaapia argillacea MUCL 33604]
MPNSPSSSSRTSPPKSPLSSPAYKGKFTNRSWPQLPPEIIRLVATHYIVNFASQAQFPRTWALPDQWPFRGVYAVLRDANELEKLMYICPSWSKALEEHLFWHQAIATVDPMDTLIHHSIISTNNTSAPIIRLSPHRHFRNIINCSCYVCRINHPYTPTGLTNAKRTAHTAFLGVIPVCREHRKVTFCGLCLREAPPIENENDRNPVCCAENEDEEMWPGIEATCRSCRGEWLYKKATARDREALGGAKWNAADWETRQSIDAFIEMGEGTISDVISLAQEKHWLRNNTKLADMLQQALAASRYASREEGYESEEELSEEDEEDPELLSMTEESGVKDLAINDWARNRILDGFWISPADQWYNHFDSEKSPAIRAIHPCPWSLDPADSNEPEDAIHPLAPIVRGEIPPSFQLCEFVYRAFQRQMRAVLLPAMTNIVRKLVIECGADGVDPAMKALRMDVEEVATALRDDKMWYNGIDWLERRANRQREEQEQRQRERREEDEESSNSSKSGGSHTTSPVLSTSTLETTPSPPPSATLKKDGLLGSNGAPAIPIPVSPVLDRPALLRPIPYVPVSISHLPPFSIEAFRLVWREACAPLYQCRCKVCERAMLKANIEAGNIVPSQTQQQQPQPQEHQNVEHQESERPGEIRIDQGDEDAVAEEEEEGEDEVDEEEYDDDASETSVSPDGFLLADRDPSQLSRKRSSRDDDLDGQSDHDNHYADTDRSRRCGTPPKRARRHEPYSPLSSPARMRKRSSEELEDDDDSVRSPTKESKKRLRVEENVEESAEESNGTSPPTSATGVLSPEEDIEEDHVEVSATTNRTRGLVPRSALKTAFVVQDPKTTPRKVASPRSNGVRVAADNKGVK